MFLFRTIFGALKLNYLAKVLKAPFLQLNTTNKWINKSYSYRKEGIGSYNENTQLMKPKCLRK